MESSNSNDSKQKQYFRLTITYSDGETSARVFSSHEKAEKYGARQRRSPVVKKTKVEAFTRERYEWHKSRMNCRMECVHAKVVLVHQASGRVS